MSQDLNCSRCVNDRVYILNAGPLLKYRKGSWCYKIHSLPMKPIDVGFIAGFSREVSENAKISLIFLHFWGSLQNSGQESTLHECPCSQYKLSCCPCLPHTCSELPLSTILIFLSSGGLPIFLRVQHGSNRLQHSFVGSDNDGQTRFSSFFGWCTAIFEDSAIRTTRSALEGSTTLDMRLRSFLYLVLFKRYSKNSACR